MDYKAQISQGRLIGEGFFGEVREGSDHVHGKVAIKLLRQGAGESAAEWVRRMDDLLLESQRLKAAEHPNIVRVHNLVRADSDNMLRMICEFCDGGSLQKDFESGPMPLFKVRQAITDTCLGLEAIHRRGMFHRDIKPSNLLRSGNSHKIGDFGLVTDNLVLGYASLAGYEDHLAPEVYRDRVTSARSDIWALGMTIYRLLHGKEFYDAFVKPMGIADSIRRGGFAIRLPWLAHIPREWRRFIHKALHDDRTRRYQSALLLGQAAGLLPTDPRWKCEFSERETVWSLQKSGKTTVVKLRVLSPRKHMWTAENVAAGNRKRINGSRKPLSRNGASVALEKFFLK